MENFFTLAEKVSNGVSDLATVGAAIIYATVRNRIDHKEIYHRGNVKEYRNKEAGRIYRAVTEVTDERSTLESVIDRLNEPMIVDRLDRKRNVYEIYYAYDAVKYLTQQYLIVHKTGEERKALMRELSAVVGEAFVNAFYRVPKDKHDDYALRRKTGTYYTQFLQVLSNRIRAEFHHRLIVRD